MLYEEYLDYWLESHVRVAGELTTYKGYKDHVDTRIKDGLGHFMLVELNPLVISDFYASLQEPGQRRDGKGDTLSPNTIRKIHATVRSSLTQAVRWRLITGNPAADATLPPHEEYKRRVWDEKNLYRFLEFISGHPFELFIVLLSYSAMRFSEIAALRWDQVNWSESYITIERALKQPGKNWIDGKTKNKRVRDIPVPFAVLEKLRRHRIEQNEDRHDMGADWNPKNLVFTSRNGTPVDRSNFHNRVWVPLQREFNKNLGLGDNPLPYLNIHGLRHTLGTIFARMDRVKDGADILGHHSTTFFMDTYVHPEIDDRRESMDDFAARLQGAASQNLPKRKWS